MKTPCRFSTKRLAALVVMGLALAIPLPAFAHCDTLDGPVVIDARTALEKADITPVLKWVKTADEQELRAIFAKTLAVRKLDPTAKELADTYFFETLVRVHRAGEGAPYTGLKGAGTVPAPIVKADQSLEKGDVNELAKAIGNHAEAGVRERFKHAFEAKKHVGESVAAGRDFVAAYVTYVHYVEGVVAAVHAGTHHGEAGATGGHQH